MRYGTRTHSKRRWTRQGHRPICQVKLGYQWGYLYVAICPFTGDVFAMLFTHLDKACFSIFLEHLQAYVEPKSHGRTLLIGDGATAHTCQAWHKYKLDWQQLPTACPELNPVERFFQELRRHTSNRVFNDKDQVEQLLVSLVTDFKAETQKIKKMTLYPYIKQSA